ncbi:hypothetical protein M9435_004416 [Picochlorum sp. BPE23]|nr:hypothetical protein M9435_004416 [Picochlorum sp. BPE23]
MCVERSRRFWYLCLVALCSSGLAYSRDLIHLNHETYPKSRQEDIIGQHGRGILSVAARKVLADNGAADCGDNVSLDIIHMNDLHAHYTPATLSIGDCPEGSEDVCFGGMARIQTAVDTLLSEANNAGQDSLVLHAGDQFTGTIWDNIYTKENIQIAPQFFESSGPYLLGGKNSTNPVEPNATVVEELDALSGPIKAARNRVVGTTSVLLDGTRENVRNMETNLGGIIADSYTWYLGNTSSVGETYKGVPWVGMSFGGAIRANIDVGNITAEDCDSVLPFDDYVYVQLLNGTVLYAALNNGVSGWTGTEVASGRFPQISKELEFSFNPDPSVPQYSRVVNSNLRDQATGEYKPLESYDRVILITNEFAATGGDNYTMLATAPVISQIPVADNLILCQYFGLVSPVNENTVETNRIVNCAIDSDDTLCSTTSPSEPVSEQSFAVTRRTISLTVFIVSTVFLFS